MPIANSVYIHTQTRADNDYVTLHNNKLFICYKLSTLLTIK